MVMALDALSDVPDEALLIAYGNGDRDAARALTLRLTPRVLGYAARVLSDRAEAEDVAQEAMLRLWRQAPKWRQGEAKVTTWLYRVVANLCTDRLRKARGQDLESVPEPEDDAPGAEAGLQQAARAQQLREELGLTRPIHVQYLDWLGHMLRGDLGQVIHHQRDGREGRDEPRVHKFI